MGGRRRRFSGSVEADEAHTSGLAQERWGDCVDESAEVEREKCAILQSVMKDFRICACPPGKLFLSMAAHALVAKDHDLKQFAEETETQL